MSVSDSAVSASTAAGDAAATGGSRSAAVTGSPALTTKWSVEGEAMCPYRLVLEHVTSRWGVLVLIELLDCPYRFSELRRAIGRVSEKMLTQTLQTLERDGLVNRDAKPVIPPRVDYSLTDLGREAADQVKALAGWTEERMDAVLEARQAYDERKAGQANGEAKAPQVNGEARA